MGTLSTNFQVLVKMFIIILSNKCFTWKTFDAVVGDITILANRAELVEFTQPYAESGLSMIVPAKSEESAWMFMKPFTWEMWMATAAMLIYTMFIVWFLEHRSNPEFEGTWKTQIGTAMWFTCSSLFFAHSKYQKLHAIENIQAYSQYK